MSISFNREFGLWWPDWDEKATQNYNYIVKNLPTIDFALSQCKKFDICIQAGGHVGMWPIFLENYFHRVYTFEPETDLFDALVRNLEIQPCEGKDVKPIKAALSYGNLGASLIRSTSSGSNSVELQLPTEDMQTISAIALDSLNLPACDAIFLDIEGHELFALRGAKDTIIKYKPVIQVEELHNDSVGSLEVDTFLADAGYRRHPEKQGKDVVYLPNA